MYIGADLSTQQLKCVVIDSNLRLVHLAIADFDKDFKEKYGVEKGVLTNPAEGEIFAPTSMWLDALDLVLERLRADGLDFSEVKAISGAGMQHGTVFWSKDAESLLGSLHGDKTLTEQLGYDIDGGTGRAFSHPYSPNWQDASTQEQCDAFDEHLGSEQALADLTGSKAHHRFSGPQIMRFRQKRPEAYRETTRISLVSSFLASVFLGKIAPIDISDVCGMNLWDMSKGAWNDDLVALAAGGPDGAEDLKKKLGAVPEDGGDFFGNISRYFVDRYGFSADCAIAPFTGDNPSTILSLPLRASDAIVSLGTSTTFLMSTPEYNPDPSYHFFNHPATPGLYMFMLCYKNGALARERIRDAINSSGAAADQSLEGASTDSQWDNFNRAALSSAPLNAASAEEPMSLGLYFPLPEIVPSVPAGEWHYSYDAATRALSPSPHGPAPGPAARAILESQLLSLRLRSARLVQAQRRPGATSSSGSGGGGAGEGALPPQPRRVYLVGGGAVNPAIARLAGEVLGGAEGVFRLDVGGNACALGAAYKAVWAAEGAGKTFEELIGERWDEDAFTVKVDEGYRAGVWERYGEALEGFRLMEEDVVRRTRA